MATWSAGESIPLLAEPASLYKFDPPAATWVDVLVDCPSAQSIFTYHLPADLSVRPGDILSVPFGSHLVGAIAIRCLEQPPPDLDPAQVRDVSTIISAGFFPASYWSLLNRIADYYCTPLIQVVRVALPPGLLNRSQRRIRLLQRSGDESIHGTARPALVTPPAHQLLNLLQASETGDYSWIYLQRQVKDAHRGLQELLKVGYAESYLEPPTPPRPKQRLAVTLVTTDNALTLTPRQQEILSVLKRQGGELWLADLLQLCQATSSVVKALEKKGCVVVQPREVLRAEAGDLPSIEAPKVLSADQAHALAQINALSEFTSVLLHGVTGSGKTEVYLQAIAPVLQRGQSALVLVPEIGLTPQLTDRFRARFGSQVCVYHSALSEGERYDTWRQMLSGEAQVVIGTRSAVFAPLPKLGIIVLDEEHDTSFKQDQPAPCYHARMVARWRAELENCPLILGSATPSLESWVEVQRQKPQDAAAAETTPSSPSLYLSLPTRIQAHPLPTIDVIDMRQELRQGNRSIFSGALQDALDSLRSRKQQGILFIHRRGHSTFVSCRSCGYVMTCPHCDVSLAHHQIHAESQPILRCHYCNYTQSLPNTCPSCDSLYFKYFGSGTQRVTQTLEQQFPDLRVLRFDSDTTRTKGSHRAILTQFAQGDADLLVGTQMLTKGIDLPQVTLVGVVAADGLLHLSDYRTSERAFQTLTQVAGRCGRGEEPGRVILQTYSPEHPVIQAVKHHQYVEFVEGELAQRAALNYPPHGRLILLRFSSSNPVAVQQAAERVAQALEPLQAAGVQRLGPAPAVILRVARRYRWQLLLKCEVACTVPLPELSELRALCPSTVSVTIDVDPLNLS